MKRPRHSRSATLFSCIVVVFHAALGSAEDALPRGLPSCNPAQVGMEVEACLGHTAATQRQLAFLKKHFEMK